MPVAPLNLAKGLILFSISFCRISLWWKTFISFPRVDGDAACPWVLASRGIDDHDLDFEFNILMRESNFLVYISLASLRSTPYVNELMSSLVKAKWTKYSYFFKLEYFLISSLIKYSTALTSWLVFDSIFLILFADFSLKSFLIVNRFFFAALDSDGNFLPHWVVKKINQSISISNRVLFKIGFWKILC